MIILHIETSTTVCSVALSEDSQCIFSRSNGDGLNHATMLSPFIQEAMDFLKNSHKNLDAVAVSGGPGSYTGLRIGVSTAKGLCYGLELPLIAVDTLEIITMAAIKKNRDEDIDLFCPMIDARRMEVYTAFYNSRLKCIEAVSADIITPDSYQEILNSNKVLFFGNGAEKCMEVIKHEHALYLPDIIPLAENMIFLAEEKYQQQVFVNVAYYEPFYLKEFQATTPKKNL
ncbi:MAG: tRNA (adenosine(37)-N6)-threonylcarbamoyltransferase complex dimerization subunit type 1 TsaB [Paludibacter sp.]|nr:tRNA (adenosine(37)-N6)-threonylcarbamoyltransferase complex dimerization subunit type 1 TsaB [Paludibacter sp.]